MKTAFQCIKATLGESIARLVCIDNPLSVLNGDDIGAVLLLDNDWQLK
jgi:hypothetical protein